MGYDAHQRCAGGSEDKKAIRKMQSSTRCSREVRVMIRSVGRRIAFGEGGYQSIIYVKKDVVRNEGKADTLVIVREVIPDLIDDSWNDMLPPCPFVRRQ